MLKLTKKQREIVCREMGWNKKSEAPEDLREWKQFDWILTIPGATPGLENDDIYVDEEFPYLIGYTYYGQFYGICNVGNYILSLLADEVEAPTKDILELTLQQKKVLFVEMGWHEDEDALENLIKPWVITIPGETARGCDNTSVTDEYPYSVGTLCNGEYVEWDCISLALWQELLYYPDRQVSSDRPHSKGQAFTWLINEGGKK